ncbi:proline-alanine-rich protein [Spissistilus festinus virus 1]|uniref:Proline-alanine-rich protein n=1 Tax=Spissistilus festinus virus 1 TaxID=862943 RepID=D9D9L7_9VIRU|nr:proline-alanine-rich protein [Spissistilus festinus virus 1]ADK12921.1 proline-alanine-rich protein [Spissistilus festinus virus 1]
MSGGDLSGPGEPLIQPPPVPIPLQEDGAGSEAVPVAPPTRASMEASPGEGSPPSSPQGQVQLTGGALGGGDPPQAPLWGAQSPKGENPTSRGRSPPPRASPPPESPASQPLAPPPSEPNPSIQPPPPSPPPALQPPHDPQPGPSRLPPQHPEPRPPRSAGPPPSARQQQWYTGQTLLYNSVPTGRESWWGAVARVGEDLGPAVVAIGLGFLQPELLPILPALTAEAEAEIAAATDAAAAWAALRSHLARQEAEASVPPPENLVDALAWYRERVGRPSQHPRLAIPPHRLAVEAATRVPTPTNALGLAITRWASHLFHSHPEKFTKVVVGRNMFGSSVEPHHTDPQDTRFGRRDKQSQPTTVTLGDGSESLWMKLGEHSIHSANLTANLLVDETDISQGVPDFCSKYGTALRNNDTNFQHVANVGLQVGSGVALSTSGGGYDAPVNVWGTVLCTHNGPIPLGDPVARHGLHVHGGPAREMGRFTQTAIASLLQSGVPSERFVGSAINPNLAITSLPALKNLTASIMEGWEYYDNSLLYAKLWHYVMLNDFFSTFGIAPEAQAFPQGQGPTWINVTDANLDIYSIPNAISRRDLVFIEGQDIFEVASDLQLIYWIVTSAFRYDGPVGAQTPHQCYTEWPQIGVTVLARRAAPAAPAAAVVPSPTIVSFLTRMATRRNEWDSALKGLYLAMELFGVRLNMNEDEYWPIRTCLSAHNPWVPKVADYNFMFRLLKIFPDIQGDHKPEVGAFISLSASTRTRVVALYNAIMGAAATTVLYDLNITRSLLVSWCTGDVDTPPTFVQIMTEGLNQPQSGNDPQECTFFCQARAAFPKWIGANAASNLFPEDTWNGDFNNNAGAEHAYEVYNAAITPANFTPLIILEWLKVLPFEWGICSARPTLNLREEIRLRGLAAAVGWYANRGSDLYRERAVGDFPMKVVAYGVQVVNALAQGIRLAAVPGVGRQATIWEPYGSESGANPPWGPSAAVPAGDISYAADIHTLRPCSLMSFDYATDSVWAPTLLGAALGPGEVQRLTCWTGQTAEMSGVILPMVGIQAPPLRLPGRLNLLRIGGVRARVPGVDNVPQGAVEVVAPDALAANPAGNPQ